MVNLLDSIYEYQSLLHRSESMEIPLDAEERARLEGLRRLLRGDYLGLAANQNSDEPRPVPVQLTVPGGFATGEVRSMSAKGMALVSNRPISEGMRTILRVADPLRGFEYVFPGRVVWRSGRILGVAFDGLPSKTPFLVPTDSWRPGRVRFGPGRSRPLVA